MKMTKCPSIACSCVRQTADHALASVATILGRLLMSVTVVILLAAEGAGSDEPGNHLFILSGQSNMTGGLKSGFSRSVEAHYGKENITVVHHCKPGRGIRFWDKDYKFPANYRFPGKGAPSERSKQQHGEVYGPLIEKVRNACKGKSHDTITFIWMQGESDGMRGLGGVYEESFLRLLGRLKTDLDRKDISFVIGRINDAPLNGPSAEHWRRVRDVQVKLAEDADRGAWIDTDDFSEPGDGVHFPVKKYPALGSRFAAQAIELIRKRAASAANEPQGDDKSR